MSEPCPNCERLEKRIAVLEAENAEIPVLRARIAQLELLVKDLLARLNINSQNSHKPPSSDIPTFSRGSGTSAGRKRRRRPGIARERIPPERIDEFFTFRPGNCGNCGKDIRKECAVGTVISQQIELPTIKPITREFHCQIAECPICHHRTQAPIPAQFGPSIVGPKLASFVASLRPKFHLSVRQIQELLVSLMGTDARISLGTIINTERTISEAISKIYVEAKGAVQKSPILWIDETGWSESGKRQWLWVATQPGLTIFHLDSHRNQHALKSLIGGFSGILTSDRWGSYNKYPNELRQLCFSHLKRDFQKLADRKMGAEILGNWGKGEIKKSIILWRNYRLGLLSQEKFNFGMRPIRARFKRLLKQGVSSPDKAARALCKNLKKNWMALWTFARHPDLVEPTNNRAERALRPEVIWRKICQGSKSARGLTFAQRFMTITATLSQQGRKILGFLEEALLAFRSGTQAPSILSLPGG